MSHTRRFKAPGYGHFKPSKELAKVASSGTLLVDTGTCSSVCRLAFFKVRSWTLDPNAVEELYTVDDTPLKARGEIRPQLRLGDKVKEKIQVTFQVVEGVNENTLSVNRALDMGASVQFESDNCYIQWVDGKKTTFARQGNQFPLPLEELEQPTTRYGKVAAIDEADEDAMAVQTYAMQEDEEAEAAQEYARREEEEEVRNRVDPNGFFFSPEKEEGVEDESRLVTILCRTNTVTCWPLALQLPNQSTEIAQPRYCPQNVGLYLKNLGYNKVILQHDGEPSIRALALCGSLRPSSTLRRQQGRVGSCRPFEVRDGHRRFKAFRTNR